VITRVIADTLLPDVSLAARAATYYRLPLERCDKEALVAEVTSLPIEERFAAAKQILFFTVRSGPFVSACRCTAGADYRCCGYYTVQSVSGCPFDCSYCVLQYYLRNNPFISVFVNRDSIEEETSHLVCSSHRIRIGTGELADSLALDDFLDESGFFAEMIERNGWQKYVSFEFKTKSAQVRNLISAKERHSSVDLVFGLSVNIERVVTEEEHGVAPMADRVTAAQRFIEVGGRVAFHFDPIVMREEFLGEYLSLVTSLCMALPSKSIAWVSLGALRYPIPMGTILRRRFPASLVTLCETFPFVDDHKVRIFAPLRSRFYRSLVQKIRTHLPDTPIYLCMERNFMWERAGLAT